MRPTGITDWEDALLRGDCQFCHRKPAQDPNNPKFYDSDFYVVHHIRYRPVTARVFLCKECHARAHRFKKGYQVIWPLERKPEDWRDYSSREWIDEAWLKEQVAGVQR